jgi:hypothetical protein
MRPAGRGQVPSTRPRRWQSGSVCPLLPLLESESGTKSQRSSYTALASHRGVAITGVKGLTADGLRCFGFAPVTRER